MNAPDPTSLNRLVGEAVILQAWLWDKQRRIEALSGRETAGISERIAEIAVNCDGLFGDREYSEFMLAGNSWADDDDVDHVTGARPSASPAAEMPPAS